MNTESGWVVEEECLKAGAPWNVVGPFIGQVWALGEIEFQSYEPFMEHRS